MPLPPRTRRARHSAPRRPRWGLRLAAAAALLVLVISGAGHTVVHGIERRLGRTDPFAGLRDRPRAGLGTTILVVGTDGRDAITAAERDRYRLGGAPCHCTDAVMLVHLSEARDRVTVVGLPRDSYAVLPEHKDLSGARRPAHPQKLNAAYAEGGPRLTVRTVEQLTGVHVDHYLEVDFTGFMRTVDLLGGVRVCTEQPLRDDWSGLDLPSGTSTLDGGRALQYVRSRHLGSGSDLERMQRQQRFLAALLERAAGSGVLTDPPLFHEVAVTVLGAVRADRDLGGEQLVELGRAARNLTPATAEFTSVPVSVSDFPVPGVGSTVRWDGPGAERIFGALRADRPLAPRVARGAPGAHDGKAGNPPPSPRFVEVPPGRIRVQVLDGSGRPGLGRAADTALRATGFATTGVPAAAPPPPVPRTEIAFDPRWDRSARTLAAALPGTGLRAVAGQGPVMKVTLGADFGGVQPVRALERARPQAAGEDGRVLTGDRVVCPPGS
ncbi:LCP family protein [Streptomyces sp. AV19]|uniref:LCP family protein n=1 Tax=Streptomyces sp. AV19 TaxID=2793068 RepID=UPI0018FE0D67|nr:LCP family protein [Streptomyces sp. AV19]MBH1935482.1 LCP family protein [Streptomyces sp. AV19]MDG4531368.1 LCP family protein [Streptomyces sp. AV19]